MANSFAGKAKALMARCAIWSEPILSHLDAKVNSLRPPSPNLAPGLEYLRCVELREALKKSIEPELSTGNARKILSSVRDLSRQHIEDKAQRYALYLIVAIATLTHTIDLYTHIISFADQLESCSEHWRKRVSHPMKNILEHTPWFWANYYFPFVRNLAGKNKPIHPKVEVQFKLEILGKLETIFLFAIGALNYVVSLSKLETIHDLHVFTGHLLRLCSDFHENLHGLKTPWFKIDLLNQLNNDQMKLARLFALAEIEFENTSRFQDELGPVWNRVKIPRSVSRNWIYYGIGAFTAWSLYYYAQTHQDQIVHFFDDMKIATHSFYENQIKGVVKGIWETIRYEEDEQVLRIKQKAVQASEESLGRMVLQFNEEKGKALTPAEIETIRLSASHGDLSTIMPSYELEIENPIRNALFSDFIRLALIQVQKQKVDIENAMLQIDKLLRANELNFQILAAAPVLVILVLIAGFITRERVPHHTHKAIRTTLRQTHSLLTFYKSEEQGQVTSDDETEREPLTIGGVTIGLDCVSYGKILLSLHRLTRLSEGLSEKHKEWFKDDLRQVETESFSVDQRLLTLQRMYSTYPFLALS